MRNIVGKLRLVLGVVPLVSLISICLGADAANERGFPALKPQPTPQAVVDEHLAALNAYDWQRLMAQYPEQIEIHLPNGGVVAGKSEVAAMFDGLCKPYQEGGFKGAVFTALQTQQIGDTVVVQWVVDAPFLQEPYKGVDAYITADGLMVSQVSTFNTADIKFKN